MALYKDTNGNIHDDMDGQAKHLLPEGCVEITQQEADAIVAAKQQAAFDALSYADKRRAEYAPLSDFKDAMVKLNSPDPAVAEAGKLQFDAIVQHDLAVKAKYPKPI